MRPRQGWLALPALLWVTVASFGFSSPVRAQQGGWTLPDDRVGIRTAPLLLLSRPDIQTDLRMEPVQVQGAHSAIEDLSRRGLALRGKNGPEVIVERRKIDEAQIEWLGKNLSSAQLIRLRQIEFQWEGVSAILSHAKVADYLKLSPEQRQSLARIVAERRATRMKGGPAASDEPAFNQQAQAILSPEQRELWAGLLGTPVHFIAATSPQRTRDTETQRAGHTQTQP